MQDRVLFFGKVLTALAVLSAVGGVIGYVVSQLGEGWGLMWAILAGISLGLGILLFYWNTVDWLNLRYIRELQTNQTLGLRDGTITCVTGKTRSDSKPLIAPFTQQECAGYRYSVSRSTSHGTQGQNRSRNQIVAEGLHMLATRIEGPQGSVRLGAFPAVESELRDDGIGKWIEPCKKYLSSLIGTAPKATQLEREARKIAYERAHDGPIHEDFCMLEGVGNVSGYNMTEEVVPYNSDVCAVGNYNSLSQSLTGEKARIGPNLMIYQGTPTQVLERVGAEVRGYVKTTLGFFTFTAAVVIYATIFGGSA